MEPLDLKKFAWNKKHENYTIIAITDFQEFNVVVCREQLSNRVEVYTVDEFCLYFQATYEIPVVDKPLV